MKFAVAALFGVPLITPVLVFSVAQAGSAPLLWAFAGPREDTLEGRVKARAAACGRGLLLPLKLLAWQPVVADRDEVTRAELAALATRINLPPT